MTFMARVLFLLMLSAATAAASSSQLIHAFQLSEGESPYGPPSLYQGNFYGTTAGGVNGYGNVYRLYPKKDGSYAFVNLHEFTGSDGTSPSGLVAIDPSGNLFGATASGGAMGAGTLWELVRPVNLTDQWTFEVLASFGQLGEGGDPIGGVIYHSGGIYGITSNGIFSWAPDPAGVMQFSIIGFSPPASQQSIPSFDAAGNLYHLFYGGASGSKIYRYSPNGDGTWTGIEIAAVSTASGGPAQTTGGVLMNSTGTFYGLSTGGGWYGGGTIYKVYQVSFGNWNTQVLRSFNPSTENYAPLYWLLEVKNKYYGDLSSSGGEAFQAYSSATSKQWSVNDLLDTSKTTFGTDYTGLSSDAAGNIYGASTRGGDSSQCPAGCGAVWKITP